MKTKLIIICALATIFLLPQFAAAQAAAQAEWTLMFYMDADNNLEASQMVDLEEMMKVGSSASVNLIVLADRSVTGDDVRGYTNRAVGSLKNWTTAKLMVVEKGKLRQLADWGEINMGDPATLKRFLQTATTQFPAKRFGLVFGDHGSGWVGIVSDENSQDDTLTSVELPSALREITAKTGKLELIGFDACLMANFEVAKAIAPFGKTMVASEELEPGDGWSYTPIMTALTKNPQMDGVTLGKTVVDAYKNYYLAPNQTNRDLTVTLAVIDLGKIPALETAVSNLGIRNQGFMKSRGRNTWNQISRARSQTEQYGESDEAEEAASHLFDVIDYAQKIKLEKPDVETVRAADAAIAGVKTAVVYKTNGTARPHSSGLSIYFPSNAESANGDYELTPFSLSGKWMPFLSDFLIMADQDQQAPVLDNVRTNNRNIARNTAATFTARATGDDIDEALFVLAESSDTEQIIIGAIPAEPDENGVLREEWDGEWFAISDGKKESICPITDFAEIEDDTDIYYVEVPAQVRYKGTNEWRDVTLYFYLDFNEEEVVGQFVYAFEFKKNMPREVEILAGDSIRPVYVSIDNNGDASLVAATDEKDILNVAEDDGLTVGRVEVAAGNYLLGFTVTDYAGNTSEEFTEVTIK
jgi:clostripain